MSLLHLKRGQRKAPDGADDQIGADGDGEFDPTHRHDKSRSRRRDRQGQYCCKKHDLAGQNEAAAADIPRAAKPEQCDSQPVGDGSVSHFSDRHYQCQKTIFLLIDETSDHDQQKQRGNSREQDRWAVDQCGTEKQGR